MLTFWMSVTKRLRKTTLISKKKKAITHVRKWRSFYFDPLSWRCKRLFLSFYCILCWPMRCEESCFCAMLIFLLMNRYETSSIASEISFKHFNCYRLSVQDKPSLWETSHDSNLNLCPTRLATEYLYLLLTHKRFGIRLTF